ncbi:cytochrome ubiquinol oxidase subunit I [Marinicauda pacifica]|nr:cytochrome c oxidase subunit I [Marinicauda pacifica]GGE38384.1 cytochrome ubiquinol oxidase subunit I [Marinicauda pacifica]
MSEQGTGRMTPIGLHRALDAIWRAPKGLAAFSTVNHSVVGRRFIVTAFVFFAIGGLMAMLMRAQLARPQNPFLGPEVYNQLFTLHGTVMMFLFAIPLIEGVALYLLPKLLGARDLAYPRLSAFGYWCYLFGGVAILASFVFGVAPDGGWFMYVPLASKAYSPGINADVWLLGVTFVEVSAICAAVEFVVTVLKVRTGGMALHRMPLMAWYLLITAAMMLVGFPPLILGSVLLEIERAFGWPFFAPDAGGAPLLWQHLFWLFGHPEVYIIFLPAAGVVSTLIPVFARTRIVGYAWIVAAIIALAFLSFGLWVHHMFTTGIPHLALAFFSAASTLVAIPTAVQIFAWTATLLKGRLHLSLPMLYLLGFFSVFIFGGLTGVMLAIVPFDWQVHDTHFVVAHLHYVLIGGFVFPMLAAVYYWLPLMTGRLPVFSVSRTAFWLIFIGFNTTFLVMHLTGLLGMPRRVFTYEAGLGWDLPNLISSFGGFVMAAGFAVFTLDLVLQFRFGRRFRRNPWKGTTLDWAMPTPAPSYNFAALPRVSSRDPLIDDPDLGAQLARGEGYLGRVRDGQMETLGVDMATGEPDQIIVLPQNDYLPILTALSLAIFFGCFLFGFYAFSPVGLGLAAVCVWRWLWSMGAKNDGEPEAAGLGLELPLYHSAARPPVWLGLIYFLVANGTFFASLLFGYLFLWTIAPNWPPPRMIEGGIGLAVLTASGLILSAVSAGRARALNASARPGRDLFQALAGIFSVLGGAGLVAILIMAAPPPTGHAYGAATAALLGYGFLHAGVGALFSAYAVARGQAGFISPVRATDARAPALWHAYTAVCALAGLVFVYGLPLAMGGGA